MSQKHYLSLSWVVAMVGAAAFLQVYSIQSVLPTLMHDLNINAAVAGGTVGATVLGVAVMSPFTGIISDTFGRRGFIIGAVFFLALPTGLLFFANDIAHIWWLRFLQGVSIPGITVVLIAYVGEEYSGAQRIRLMSRYVAGTILGGFAGRFLLGYLSPIIGWRHTFLVMAALSVICGIVVWQNLPRSKQFTPNPNIAGSFKLLAGHLKNRHVLSSCALGFCILFTLTGCFTYINPHLAQAPYHLTSQSLANIFAVYLIGMVVTPLSSRITLKFGSRGTMLLAIVLSSLGILASNYPHNPALWQVIAALAMMSAGVFVVQSATIAYLAAHVEQGRSLASGLYYTAYYAGGFVGTWACGIAYTKGDGWSHTVALIVAVQLVALILATLLMKGGTKASPARA